MRHLLFTQSKQLVKCLAAILQLPNPENQAFSTLLSEQHSSHPAKRREIKQKMVLFSILFIAHQALVRACIIFLTSKNKRKVKARVDSVRPLYLFTLIVHDCRLVNHISRLSPHQAATCFPALQRFNKSTGARKTEHQSNLVFKVKFSNPI